MELSQAAATVEYKIATESANFSEGRPIRMDINNSWPAPRDLEESLRRSFPYISVSYDYQANDQVQLVVINQQQRPE